MTLITQRANDNANNASLIKLSCSVNKALMPATLLKRDSKRLATLLKKRLQHRCFPVNFARFLRTPFLIKHPRQLLLNNINITKFGCVDGKNNYKIVSDKAKTAQKIKFSVKDLVRFTEEILIGKLHFLCSVS